jgi:hypothetical protein
MQSTIKKEIMTIQNKRLTVFLLSIPILLLIPLLAMQFMTEVNWSLFDFTIMGGLLTATALMMEFIIRKVKNKKYVLALVFTVLIAFFLVWAELAVGIFGSPFAGS